MTMKEWLLLKYIPISRLEYKNHTLFMPKMVEISLNWYPIYDQNSWKTIPFGAAHTYIREYPPPPPGSRKHLTLSGLSFISFWLFQFEFFVSFVLRSFVVVWCSGRGFRVFSFPHTLHIAGELSHSSGYLACKAKMRNYNFLSLTFVDWIAHCFVCLTQWWFVCVKKGKIQLIS